MLCFVGVGSLIFVVLWDISTHIIQGCSAGTGAIIWLPQCQWSNLERIWMKLTVTKPQQTQQSVAVCIILGTYSIEVTTQACFVIILENHPRMTPNLNHYKHWIIKKLPCKHWELKSYNNFNIKASFQDSNGLVSRYKKNSMRLNLLFGLCYIFKLQIHTSQTAMEALVWFCWFWQQLATGHRLQHNYTSTCHFIKPSDKEIINWW